MTTLVRLVSLRQYLSTLVFSYDYKIILRRSHVPVFIQGGPLSQTSVTLLSRSFKSFKSFLNFPNAPSQNKVEI